MSSEKIPRLVHQIWYDKNELDNTMPPSKYTSYPENMKTWKEKNPSYNYMFWNRRKIQELWEHPELQKYKPLLDKLELIEICDCSRYAILYLYGGIYADLDFVCMKPFDDLLDKKIIFVPETNASHRWNGHFTISNSILMSMKRHWFWLYLLDYIFENFERSRRNKNRSAVYVTGPVALTKARAQAIKTKKANEKDLYLTNGCLFYPNDYDLGRAKECEGVEDQYTINKPREGTGWYQDYKEAIVKRGIGTDDTSQTQGQLQIQNPGSFWFIFTCIVLFLVVIFILMLVFLHLRR